MVLIAWCCITFSFLERAEPVAALCVCVQHGQAMDEDTPSAALSHATTHAPGSLYASLQGYRWLAVLNTLPRTPVYAVSRLPSPKRRVET
jgi:hypothetical protein